jgi:hypothetical protein
MDLAKTSVPRFYTLGGCIDNLRHSWHEARVGDRLCTIEYSKFNGNRCWRVVEYGDVVLCDRLSYRSIVSLVYAMDEHAQLQSTNSFTSNGGMSNIKNETLLDEKELIKAQPFFIIKF